MLNRRASGILLHPTSLPGPFGSGDLGESAYRFVDWLKHTGQTYWQMLPTGEIGPGNSPYMSSSAFAGNILLIDLAELARQGWLDADDLAFPSSGNDDRIDYSRMIPFRHSCLRKASHNYFHSNEVLRHEFDAFCETEKSWLDDYALFMTIAKIHDGCPWNLWPSELAQREKTALEQIRHEHAEEIDFWKFCQWSFARQWLNIKNYARQHGIRLIGDAPIFVAHQSADVWAHQELFFLDNRGNPTVVAGVPPDYFSATGQLWGNPLYRWDVHEQTGFSWWIERLRHALRFSDFIHIDHFRGFAGYWEIPADAPTAISGRWVDGPGEKFFDALQRSFHKLPIIAEDLGVITPDVIELRDKFKLPGMRILQFAFGGGEENYFLPHHYIVNTVAYTGTHDNDTSVGWWRRLPDHERGFVCNYLHTDGSQIHLVMMGALSASAANTVVYPLQDVMGLDSEHRMNFPGNPDKNWEWRFNWEMLKTEHGSQLLEITVRGGRNSS